MDEASLLVELRAGVVEHVVLAPETAAVLGAAALRQVIGSARVVLFSESSGGNLALAAMLGLVPGERPAGVVAISPVTDLSLRSPSIDANAATDSGVDRRLLEFLCTRRCRTRSRWPRWTRRQGRAACCSPEWRPGSPARGPPGRDV